MRAMVPKLLGVPLARDTDHQPEVPVTPGLDPRDGILYYHRSCRRNHELLCRREERIWGGLAGQVLRMDRVAIDAHLEESIQLRGF
jgi:hypothetical protein